MEEVKKVLELYGFGGVNLESYTDHSHDPDMWSHAFSINGNNYILVEIEAIGSELQDEDYSRLEEDLRLTKENLKLVLPKLEQMHTAANQAGIGIDGHKTVTNVDDGKSYKNPSGLDTGTSWILFVLN